MGRNESIWEAQGRLILDLGYTGAICGSRWEAANNWLRIRRRTGSLIGLRLLLHGQFI